MKRLSILAFGIGLLLLSFPAAAQDKLVVSIWGGSWRDLVAETVAKKFTQREGINYIKTFSPISKKDSFRIVMALLVHFDLELHQMDVKTTFLKGDLHENIQMARPEGFVMEGKVQLGCKLKKFIYGLK